MTTKVLTENNLDIIDNKLNYGELWLLSDRVNYQSRVINGCLKDITLNELWNKYKTRLFKSNHDKPTFPLLIKLIDTAEDLSLQVHPKEDDLIFFNNAESKTEMWYVIDSQPSSNILAGFNNSINVTKQKLIQVLDNPYKLKKLIKHYISKPHQYFFIPAGTIHTIGKGNLIFEIQQNSDTTFRISDWGRVDSKGKSRELHVNEALLSLNFNNSILHGQINIEQEFIEKEVSPLNKYFKMFICNLYHPTIISTLKTHKFLTLITGNIEIYVNNKNYMISQFFTVLLPLGYKFKIIPLTQPVTLITYY